MVVWVILIYETEIWEIMYIPSPRLNFRTACAPLNNSLNDITCLCSFSSPCKPGWILAVGFNWTICLNFGFQPYIFIYLVVVLVLRYWHVCALEMSNAWCWRLHESDISTTYNHKLRKCCLLAIFAPYILKYLDVLDCCLLYFKQLTWEFSILNSINSIPWYFQRS